MGYEWIPSSNASEPSAFTGVAGVSTPAVEIDNAGTGPSLKVVPTGVTSASTSTGGAVNLDNSANTGAGLVVFSSQAAPSGRLIVGRYSSSTASQTAIYGENAGTGHAVHGNQTAASPNASGSAGNFTSSNSGASCVQVSGVETGRGSIKVTHTAAGGDANASGLSIDLQGAGTAAKGIFVDSVANGTTGTLLDLRNNGNQIFSVITDATFAVATLRLGTTQQQITTGTGAPAFTAPKGSLYLRQDGGAGSTLYVNETGTSTWAAK